MDEVDVSPGGPRPARAPSSLRTAAGGVALEAVALAALGIGYAVSGLVGAPEDRTGTVLGGALALVVGLGLLPVARGLALGRSWAVAPTLVVQVLLVVVAVSLLQAGVLAVGLPVLLCAAVVLVGLGSPASRAALQRAP